MLKILKKYTTRIFAGESVQLDLPRRAGKTHLIHNCIIILNKNGKRILLLSKTNDFQMPLDNCHVRNEEEFKNVLKSQEFDIIFIDDIHLFHRELLPKSYECQIIISRRVSY